MKPVRSSISPVFSAWLQAVSRRMNLRRISRTSALLPLTVAMAMAASSASLPPEPPLPDSLDLHAAISFALENNFSIRQAKERIRQQEGVIIETSARQIPTVSANGTYQTNDHEISSSIPQSDRTWAINLTASQIVYAGGGVRSSVRSSKLTRDAAILDLQSTINDALLQVRVAFYNVLLAREKITVQESNLELLQSQLKTATDRFRAGTVSSFEQLRAEVAVANARVPLITARNDYRLAIESLRQALGVGGSSGNAATKIPDVVGSLEFAPVNFDLNAAFDAAHANRPDLQRLGKLFDAREELVTTARSGYLPTVSVYGGWASRKGPTTAFRDSYDGFLAGVQSQWNIFDGRATAGRVAQARSALEQTRLSFGEAKLAVDVDVRRTYSQWQEATELAEASRKVVEQATESVRLANARYAAGTSTQLDTLQAQVDLTTAKTNQIQAYYSYNVAVAALRKAMGQGDEFVTH